MDKQWIDLQRPSDDTPDVYYCSVEASVLRALCDAAERSLASPEVKRAALEQAVIDAALRRLVSWEEKYPAGIDPECPPTADGAIALIQATKALRDSQLPQRDASSAASNTSSSTKE